MQGSEEKTRYVCACYIPPEGSAVYRNVNSSLFDFDFFECLNDDIMRYASMGEIYLAGDFNSRTGELLDYVENINLNRFVPIDDYFVKPELTRKSKDKCVNAFGHKLISILKENALSFVNGRLEEGKFTCYSVKRDRQGASVVDYVITHNRNFKFISNFNVLDLTEFTDHCPITFNVICNKRDRVPTKVAPREILSWDSVNSQQLLDLLETKRDSFNDITHNILENIDSLDENILKLTELMYDCSFKIHGKILRQGNSKIKGKNEWFNHECRNAKARFLNSRRAFNESNTIENRNAFLESRRNFCLIKRKAKRKFSKYEKKQLTDLSRTDPKKFWKRVNGYRQSKQYKHADIDANQFRDYFSEMLNDPVRMYTMSNDFSYNNEAQVNIECLDKPFEENEILKIISSLGKNKAAGIDKVVNEFFIDAKLFITPFLVKIFNKIYESGKYPSSWTRGIIVPIHKKGDKSEPANYRGITLINSIAKIFSLTLRNRLNIWCEQQSIFNDVQFGFRSKRSTTDCVFILHSIIQKVLSNNQSLYCAFIDYEKAFDTIVRDAMWYKLLDIGVSSKMVTMLKSIYEHVSDCVRHIQIYQISLKSPSA
jgi:hypothetical protein